MAWLRTGDIIRIDLNKFTADMLVDEEEIEKKKGLKVFHYTPDSQTPWQEIYRNGVSQIDKGAVLEDAVKKNVKKDIPRNNH